MSYATFMKELADEARVDPPGERPPATSIDEEPEALPGRTFTRQAREMPKLDRPDGLMVDATGVTQLRGSRNYVGFKDEGHGRISIRFSPLNVATSELPRSESFRSLRDRLTALAREHADGEQVREVHRLRARAGELEKELADVRGEIETAKSKVTAAYAKGDDAAPAKQLDPLFARLRSLEAVAAGLPELERQAKEKADAALKERLTAEAQKVSLGDVNARRAEVLKRIEGKVAGEVEELARLDGEALAITAGGHLVGELIASARRG